MGLGKGLRGIMRGFLGLLAGVVMVGGMGETAGGQVLPELSFTGAFPVSGDPGTNECPRGEELESSTDKVWEGGWLALRVERAATRREAARIEVDFEIVGGSQAGRADLGTGGNLRNVGILFYESVITAPTRHCHYVQILKDKKLEGNERLTLRLRPKGSVYTVKAGKDRRDIEIGEAGAGIRLRYQDLGVLGGGTTGRGFVLRLEAGVASGAGNACTFERDRSFSRTVKVGWRVWDGGRGDLRGASLGDFNLPTRVTFRSGVAVVEGSARADGDRESEDFWMELDYKYRDRVNHPYPVVHCESAADARRWGLTRSFFGPVGVIAPVPGAPAKPLGLTAGAVEDRVNLSWRAATDGTIKGWRYRLRAKGLRSWGSGVEMRGSVAGTRAHAVDGSSWWDGIATEFQVQSYNDGGSSPWSDTAVAVAVNRDRPALVISKGRVSVEEGETASWTVALNGGVGGSVTLASSASGTARVSPAVLTFTSENARVPQTVRVTGVTAGEAEVRHAFTLPGATAAAVTDAGRVAVTVTAAAVPLRAPAKPTDLSAKAVEDEVGLSWKAATDATIQGWRYRYRMFDYWYSATDFPGKTTASTRSGSVSFAAFLEGITLEFQVQSYNEAGSSPWSNTAKTAVVNSDRPALLISERRVSVEEGETASWTVAVNGTFDGSVTLVSSDSGKARVSPSVLYFAHATAQTPQTVTVTGVTAGEAEVSHAFRVDGASVPVASGAKDRVAVTVTAAAVPLRAPAKPTDLSAKAVEDEVGLSWKAATDATIQGWRYRYRMFDYWYSATDFPGKTTASTRSGSVSFAAFLEGITLEFQVQSYNEAGSSPWSNTAKTAVVNSDRPALLISERRVSVEEGETASWTVAVNGTFDGSVTLVSSDSGKARVSPSVLYFAHATAQTPQTVTVTGVTAGEAEVSHAFRVDGASVPVASGAKDRVAVTVTAAPVPETPSAPKGFRARPGDEAVTLSWAASGDGSIRKYEVKWRLAGPGQGWGSWAAIAGSGANTTSHTVTGLTNGQKYIFRVRAVNAGGEGKSSRARGATPMGGVTVAVEDAIVVEGDAGRRVMEFDVTLSGEPVAEVKVRVAAVAGAGSTAGAGRDFVPLSKTLFFDAYGRGSALMQTVRVEVMGDEVAEGEETFLLRLDNLVTGDSRVALAGGGEKVTATGTITDDDAAPVLAALADVTAKVGQEVSVTATATDADGDTLRYVWSRKTGETTPALPEGTDLNAARLVFTPTRAGTMTMTVTADDGHGNTDTEEVVVTVAAPAPTRIPITLRVERRNDKLHLFWTAPEDPERTGWQLRYRSFNGWAHEYFREWHDWVTIADPSARSHTLSSDRCHEGQEFELRATTDAGPKKEVASARLSPSADWLVFPIGGGGVRSTQEGAQLWFTVILRSSVIRRMSGPVRVIPVPYEVLPKDHQRASYFRDPGHFERPTDKVTVHPYGPNYLEFTPKSDWVRADGSFRYRGQVYRIKMEADEDTRDDLIGIGYRLEGEGLNACDTKYGLIRERFLVRDMTPTLTLEANPAEVDKHHHHHKHHKHYRSHGHHIYHYHHHRGHHHHRTAHHGSVAHPDGVSEGTPITLTVRSDKPVSGVLSVSLTLSDRDSSGFSAADIPGALTQTFNVNFGGGKTGIITIPTSVDADASEGVEKYTVTLNDATGYAIGEDVTVQGKLLDGPPGTGYQGFTGDTGTTVGLTLTPTALTISEGGSGTYTVVLNEAPADTVMVVPASDNTAIATVSGPLTFTTANWNTPQPVTVTGVLDDDTEDDTVTLSHSATMGSNMNVDVTGGSVTVTVEDTTGMHTNKVHRAVLPQVAAAMASQSLGAVAGRIQAVASGKAGRSLRFGVAQAAPGAKEGADGVWLEEQRRAWLRGMLEDEWGSGRGSSLRGMLEKEAENPDLRDMLDGAAFALPMGASGMSGGSVPRVAVWGRGDLDSLSGSEEDVSWDGEVWSAHLGTDVRLRADVLAGVALSHSRGELDTEVDDAGGNRVKGVYKTELTAVHPYAAWLSGDGSNLWASAGYGEGEVGVEEAERADREVEMKLTSAAAGGRGVLSEDGEWIAGGVTRVAVRGEGSMVRVKTEAGSGLEALSVDASRLRLALEGSYERALEGGGTVTPALEVGMRHDSGDVEKGVGAEVGASVSWREPGMGLTVELRTRALVAHERDREEWGVGGMVQLDPGSDGSGLFLTLTPAYGVTATDLDGLFDRTPGTSFLTGSGAEAESQLDAEVGYGFGVLGSGPMALLSPYVGFTLAERGEGSVRVGTRYTIAPAFELSFEGERSQDGGSADNSLEVRVSLRW